MISSRRIIDNRFWNVTIILVTSLSFMYKLMGNNLSFIWKPSFQILTILICYISGLRKSFSKSDEKILLMLFSIPLVVASLYSVILLIINGSDKSYYSRLFSDFIQFYLPYIQVTFIFLRFKNQGFKIIVYAATIVNILNVIWGISIAGINESFSYFLNPGAYSYDASAGLFVQHDMSFALAFIIIYYIVSEIKRRKIDYGMILVSLFTIWLGGKRTEGVAIVLVVVLFLILKYFSKKVLFAIINILFLVFVSFSYIYLSLIHSGGVDQLLTTYHIDSSSRSILWDTIFSFTPFSFGYHGIGFALGEKALFPYLAPYASMGLVNEITLHNDILELYVDFGFLGIFFWFLAWMYIIPVKIMNHFSRKTLLVFLISFVYTVIIYFTDNVMTYPIFQGMFMALIVQISYEEKEKNAFYNYASL